MKYAVQALLYSSASAVSVKHIFGNIPETGPPNQGWVVPPTYPPCRSFGDVFHMQPDGVKQIPYPEPNSNCNPNYPLYALAQAQ